MRTSPPLPAPGTGRAHGAAVIGVGGHLIQASASISNGPPNCRHYRAARSERPGDPRPDPSRDREQRTTLARARHHREPAASEPAQARQRLRPGDRDRGPHRGRHGARRRGWVRVRRRTRPGRQPAPGPRHPAGAARGGRRRMHPGGRRRAERRRGGRRFRAWPSSPAAACGKFWSGYVARLFPRSPLSPPKYPRR